MGKNAQPHGAQQQPQSKTGKAEIIVASDDAGPMERLAHSILDDVLHNVISDLLLKVHRDEKQAKAATAAIQIEKLAAKASDTAADSRPDVRYDAEFATYEDGRVTLKGNPLEKVKEILCPRCQLPRLLHPTDGKGAKKPDPGITYCKKHPFIEKPGFDIYGQTWVPQGPGRGKKKKDMKPDPTIEAASTPGGEEGGTTGKGGAASRPPNVLSYPSATCSKCKRCILVTRLNNHMGSCIGNSGRNASRAAAEKLKNGGNGGDGTPPSSQKGTPLPGSRAGSPRKRDTDEMQDGEDDDEPATAKGIPKKKKQKTNPSTPVPPPTSSAAAAAAAASLSAAAAAAPAASPPTTKKVILKTKGMLGNKKDKIKASNLNIESKVDDGDEYKPPTAAERKRAASQQPNRAGTAEPKETQVPPPTIPPLSVAATSTTPIPPPKKKVSTSKIPSPAKKLKLNGPTKPPLPPTKKKAGGKDAADAGSESSGTLSSPPIP